MPQEIVLEHKFVEFIPQELIAGTVYVSIRFATASHLCCCGCGNKIVTPIRPTDWKLIFDGKTVSLTPSIGNWSLACQSHYWITCNKVRWADHWSQTQIQAGRIREKMEKNKYYGIVDTPNISTVNLAVKAPESNHTETSIWLRIKKWWSQKKKQQ